MLGRPNLVKWLVVTVLAASLTACRLGHDDHGGAIPATAPEAVDCAGPPYRQGHGDYESGLEKVTDDARKAVDSYLDEEGFGLPDITYDETARHGGTALFTWTEGGAVLGAFVVGDGMDDVEGHHGWGVTSYAVCDPAQWPPAKVDEVGLQIWSDADGDPVPTLLIHAEAGPEHCDWQEMTFLYLGKGGRGSEFYGTPPGELQKHLTTTYASHTELPPAALDTGYQREGRELWVAADGSAAYLARSDGDAQRWPGPSGTPIRCA